MQSIKNYSFIQNNQIQNLIQNEQNQEAILNYCKKVTYIGNQQRPIGLYIKHKIPYIIPLKKNDFYIKIIDSIAQTTLKQSYKNELNVLLEAEFCFPLDNNVVIEKLICEFDGKSIEGIIKEKEQAKQEYLDNKSQGNTVLYAEKLEDTPDIMKISIGNILPSTEVQITFIYSEELSVIQNKFLGYKLPQNITPRYNNSEQISDNNSNFKQKTINVNNEQKQQLIEENLKNMYKTQIQFEINSQNPIQFLKSPSHQLEIKYENETKTQILGNIDIQQTINKDFIILLQNEQYQQQPQAILCQNEEKSQFCAKITFIPDFNNAEMDDAFKSQLADDKNNNFDVDLESARSEFIFLLDRSGSMTGKRIDKAKEALILFLQSLPSQCYFNVISFGTNFELLFKKSVLYSQQTYEEAIQKIENFSANLGGTQICEPLETIFQQPQIKNFPRQIFLLTDGCVLQPINVIQLIQKNNKKARVHTIGIGSGASTYLVNECAKKGKGLPIFVGDNEDVIGPIISLLDSVITPCLDDFSFQFNKNIVESIVPAPENIPMIIKNEILNMYIYFKKNTDIYEILNSEFQLKCFDSKINQLIKYTVVIKEIQENLKVFQNSIFKMGIYKQIQCLEDSLKFNKNENQDVYFAQQCDLKQQIQNLSIINQIISSQTSFICIVNELQDEKKGELLNKLEQQKIIIPQIINENQQDENQNSIKKQKNKKPSKATIQKNKLEKIKQQQIQEQIINGQRYVYPKSGKHGRTKPIPIEVFQQKNQNETEKKIKNPWEDDYINDCFDDICEISDNDENIQENEEQEEIQQITKEKKLKKEKINKYKNKPKDINNEGNLQKITQNQENEKINLIEILKQQQFQGYWQFSEELFQQITKNSNFISDLEPLLPDFKHCFRQNIIMTVIILTWLEKKQQDQKNSWQLIYKKSQNWLNQQKLDNLDKIKLVIQNFMDQQI